MSRASDEGVGTVVARRPRIHLPLQACLRLQPRPRLCVLIFHRVLAEADPLRPSEPTAAEFESRMRWVRDNFDVIPLIEAVQAIRAGRLRRRSLAITFDDGYADNCTVAAPILAGLGLPATFFVATAFLDGGRMFNDTVIEAVRRVRGDMLDLSDLGIGLHRIASPADRRGAISAILEGVKYLPQEIREMKVAAVAERCGGDLPDDLMMRSDQVASLHKAGMAIGGHTQSHPILKEVGLDAARREIEAGKVRLEEIIGSPVRLFAYPNGHPGRDYGPEHVKLVRESGFDGAVSTAWGAAGVGADLFQVPRFTPWDRDDWRYGLRMTRNLVTWRYASA